MEQQKNEKVTKSTPLTSKRLANIGFLLVLLGPAGLFLSLQFYGIMSESLAQVLMWILIILPGVGAVLSILSKNSAKKEGTESSPLTTISLVLCNPMFYFIYLFMCAIAGRTLAGLSWM